jgi:hypothetical protein
MPMVHRFALRDKPRRGPRGAGLACSDEAKSIAGVTLEIDRAPTLAGP